MNARTSELSHSPLDDPTSAPTGHAAARREPGASPARTGSLPLLVQVPLAFLVMSLGALLCLPLAVVRCRASRAAARTVARVQGHLVLSICGVRLTVLGRERLPERDAVYVFNHPSTLDLFVLVAMGLPRTRFFLSGHLRALLPLGVVASALGTFWTVPQRRRQRRRELFAAANADLRRTGESVALSPEGRRVPDIGPFHRGAFHLATSLRRPLVPIYLHIPDAVNPGRGWRVGRGEVQAVVQPPIDTSDWQLEDVDRHKEEVRAEYLRWQREWAG